MLNKLFAIIKDRKENPVPGSYTNELLDIGTNGISQKIGEEAVEVIIAACSQDRQRVIEESADLIYHLYVLLLDKGISLSEVENELEKRHSR